MLPQSPELLMFMFAVWVFLVILLLAVAAVGALAYLLDDNDRSWQ